MLHDSKTHFVNVDKPVRNKTLLQEPHQATIYRIERVFRQKMRYAFQLITMLLATVRVNPDTSCLQPISRSQHQRFL